MKVNVIDMKRIQIRDDESLDDYIIRIRLMKARSMRMNLEYELVKMVAPTTRLS